MKQCLPLIILFVTVLTFGESHAQSVTKLTAAEIPTVDYCELERNPAFYDQKTIRVRTIYVRSGSETSKLYDPHCQPGSTWPGSTWVEFDPSYESRTRRDQVQMLARMERESRPQWGRRHLSVIVITFKRAEVIFVGKFEAALPARVGKEVDFTNFSTSNPNDPNAASISTVTSDYAHHYHYQHVFTVYQVKQVRPISSKAAW